MADTVKRTEQIWFCSRQCEFKLYQARHGTSDLVLDPFQYRGTAASPERRQKNMIALHYTAGNNPASSSINTWNSKAALTPPKNASAHFVVELKQNRETASQPYTDVYEVMPSDTVTFHAQHVNQNAVGIEIANVGWDWTRVRHDATTGSGAARRPTDRNRWIHFPTPVRNKHDFQAYQEEQYLALFLLLRHLCLTHRIPRRFLGNTTDEKMMRWWDGADVITRSRLIHFRGILSHMNTSPDKACGGPALHRNYLFRGIIDEWWLPLVCIGSRQVERPYYMGPIDPQPNQPAFFRWVDGRLQQELFHDANLDALQETKSYFDFDLLDLYYGQTETTLREGTFAVGTNKVWHGGVHLMPHPNNRKVYAAASGTIVAARLGGDAGVENDHNYGSQRFILIRHAVHLDQENDPDGTGTRIDYNAAPKYIFTLYMHLAAFAPPPEPEESGDRTNPINPPWFNYWIRHKRDSMPDGRNRDPNRVFNPDVDVLVGDWIGGCGQFRGAEVLHFEVISKESLNMPPWNEERYTVKDDTDADALCESARIDRIVRDLTGDGIDVADILRAAPQLRLVKAYFKSEWALTSAEALEPIFSDVEERNRIWNSMRHFMWVADAVRECPELEEQLCDRNGFVWHYHPIKFMEVVNRMIEAENGQVHEPAFRNTNVTIENDYLHRFVDFTSGTPVDAPADSAEIKPYDVTESLFRYRFERQDLACKITGSNHAPGPTPPTSTRFHTALLEVLRLIREDYTTGARRFRIVLSYVCNGHNTDDHSNECRAGVLATHNRGLAVDIQPDPATDANYSALVTQATNICNALRHDLEREGGETSRSELPEGFREISITQNDLNKTIHLELVPGSVTIVWESYLRMGTSAIDVRVEGTSVIAVYRTAEEARRENELSSSEEVLEVIIVRNSRAVAARIQEEHGEHRIIGVYPTQDEAEAAQVSGNAWPAELQ